MTINEQVRARVIDAIDEIHYGHKLSYKEVMASLGDVSQVLTQMKIGKRYPTLEHIVALNTTYRYSFDWLLLGITPVRLLEAKSPIARLDEIEQEIKLMKKAFK
jgi:hypothetical protein